jgi:hypothetical protein
MKEGSHRLQQLFLLLSSSGVATSSHVYTDSFPTNDEYDFGILDPNSVYGSPYGGFSRATASRLASLPLKLPNVAEELEVFEPVHMQVRDAQGRPFVCRVYHEGELDPDSLDDSMFDTAILISEASKVALRTTDRNVGYQPVGKDVITPLGDYAGLDTVDEVVARAINNWKKNLAQLEGMCAQFHDGWWSYEWCYKGKISQFHVTIENMIGGNGQTLKVQDLVSLGSYAERKVKVTSAKDDNEKDPPSKKEKAWMDTGQKELARVTDVFLNGGLCPETGEPRVTEAVLRCCSPRIIAKNKGGVLYNGRPYATDLLSMVGVIEADTVCHYNITVCTPLLCTNEADVIKTVERQLQLPKATPTQKTGFELKDIEKMSVREILEITFGPNSNTCMQSGLGGWWNYELCPGKHVRQFHVVSLMDRISGVSSTSVGKEHILGRYDPVVHGSLSEESEWQSVVNATNLGIGSSKSKSPTAHGGNGAYFFQEYAGGDVCDHADVADSAIKAGAVGEGHIQRGTTVRYSCGNQMEMTVKEDSTCHYLVDVSIPAMCEHPFFRASISKKQVVKCLPIP